MSYFLTSPPLFYFFVGGYFLFIRAPYFFTPCTRHPHFCFLIPLQAHQINFNAFSAFPLKIPCLKPSGPSRPITEPQRGVSFFTCAGAGLFIKKEATRLGHLHMFYYFSSLSASTSTQLIPSTPILVSSMVAYSFIPSSWSLSIQGSQFGVNSIVPPLILAIMRSRR